MVQRYAAALGCWLAFAGFGALAQTGNYKVVYTFTVGTDAAFPVAALTNVGGTLFGTTEAGGTESGTVFSLDPITGAIQVYPLPYDAGELPQSNLFYFHGILYGTAYQGGGGRCKDGCGTVFQANPATGAPHFLYFFPNAGHGIHPKAGLTNVGSLLYGTTSSGGNVVNCPGSKKAAGCGAVFSLSPSKGIARIVYAFQNGSDGAIPEARLINVNGILYGTTASGGAYSAGTIFSFDPATGAEQVLYAFQNNGDGNAPEADLIDVDGTLYGTASGGGLGCNCGTVFSLNPATGVFKVVYAFKGGPDGAAPAAGLLKVGQKLYGTTYEGGKGSGADGTLFSIDIATGKEVVLHSFLGNSDGLYPDADLIDVGGTLYGTTQGGGGSQSCYDQSSYGCGTVFAYTP
jgi:uncharacterized repeat protein (TIGR03803 family)